MTLPTKILAAAMQSEREVHVDYNPNTKGLYMYWYRNDDIYQGMEHSDHAYLDWDDCDERLAIMLQKIEGLS